MYFFHTHCSSCALKICITSDLITDFILLKNMFCFVNLSIWQGFVAHIRKVGCLLFFYLLLLTYVETKQILCPID